ncbi:MAG: RNA-binding transcriptional accessory protein [Crocosphaera sp.]|uniref:RNA binding S1 n=2 Tax=Crocosphaera watsonii TaxID=263511 RepID=G5JA56_CROWT|nr:MULTISPECIES: Tex family protein [Crocosphaera]EHJ10936.1 RNA binding S1 [Crocosphaera watsonii WH 0003]MCH2245123.1 RNA-binding transcriptional accessory protein [Crocosphaera sp.]NQZ62289.1 RNA-binding transcriptional accessory protein [Crocosphaera sp.]CCQ56298.1 Transcription accessory protein (S1 RNA-binding domain) [Crocosphaera watsonii WH 0005]
MLDYNKIIATELSLQQQQVEQSLELLIEGATVPFIARYRKEKTGSLDETQLRDIWERYTYLSELDKRKDTILEAIKNQDKLTDQLQKKIESCLSKTELEDLYLPYKPKRRTKATIAREKGLEGLATAIKYLNIPDAKLQSLEEIAGEYISEEKGVNNLEEALQGASDILAEEVAEKANLRAYLRDYLMKESIFISSIKKEHPEGSTKYEMYRNFQASVTKIAPHNILALFRGETEKIISLSIDFDETYITAYLYNEEIKTKNKGIKAFYQSMLKDSFNRLIKPSLLREVRADRKNWADLESINTFEINLRELLLSPPAGMQPTLAIDPGFRTGCKVAVLSETGQFLEYQAIFPHTGAAKQKEAKNTLKNLIQKYEIELIAIGNGTASRETDQFVGEVIKPLENQPIKVIVNESGASIYSASDLAREEFPDLDITVRGAISIGRRLQDPLAELVKIDPKSIGVGQYQHDVDQKLLKKNLEETVESCVNYVGVDLNTASKQLLTFVSGITPTIANNIVSYRDKNGIFNNRKELLKVSKLGPKAYEQAAGFLRIRGGKNPLDNTAVHPESYTVVETIIKQLGVSLSDINNISSRLKSLDLNTFVTDTIGLPTLEDVIAELEKPGRDPREEFKYATFKEGVTEISDLSEGMILEGVITNVVKFGAFIDIGVHQDGLIHISQLANYFVNDTNEVVKVGEVVKVKVLEIDEKLKRVSLSMKEV